MEREQLKTYCSWEQASGLVPSFYDITTSKLWQKTKAVWGFFLCVCVNNILGTWSEQRILLPRERVAMALWDDDTSLSSIAGFMGCLETTQYARKQLSQILSLAFWVLVDGSCFCSPWRCNQMLDENLMAHYQCCSPLHPMPSHSQISWVFRFHKYYLF